MRGRVEVAGLGCIALILCACPPPGGGPGADCSDDKPCQSGYDCVSGKCEAQTSHDAGTGGPIDPPRCDYDTDCSVGEICDDASQLCVTGLDCSQNATVCGFCESGAQDCGFGDRPAYCDANDGVCRRVHTSCQPCTSAAQCTTSDAFYDNHCITYGDGKFCAVDCAHGQTCPRGFSCDGTACTLESLLGRCSDAPTCTADTEGDVCPTSTYCTTRAFPGRVGVCLGTCLSDDDCVLPKICRTDPGPRYGTCIDGCAPAGTEVGSQVCHETGHAGAYCTQDSECLAITGLGGFECHDTSGHCDGRSCSGWCVQGGCDSSAECPLPRTYCELPARECRDGCGIDLDCGAFEICDPVAHTCNKQPCRGKDLSCNLEQWCCGKELYDASSAPEHMACPSDVGAGECFDMRDPYCRTCEDNDDCTNIQKFGYASYCFELKTEDDQGNEISLGKYCSVGCESNADCPRGISCIQELPDPDGGTIKGCIDARCVP
ncbi:MAG: hypothetical protein ABIJ09_21700 [Pseudomonadota bacterium]